MEHVERKVANTPSTLGSAFDAQPETEGAAPKQMRAMAPPPFEPPVQRKPSGAANGGLPADLQGGIESMSGIAMDDVKVHYNSDKPAQMQAHAYAQGTDIHLAPGQEQHLPHEAWHVVQQKQGRVQATTQLKGAGINDDAGLEREADVMGAKAAANASTTQPVQRKGFSSPIIQRIVKPDVTQKGFVDQYKKHYDKTKDLKGALEAFYQECHTSSLIIKQEDMRAFLNQTQLDPKKIKKDTSKFLASLSADADMDFSGERGHAVSRHVNISDKELEGRLRGPGAIAAASRFSSQEHNDRRAIKLLGNIKALFSKPLKEHFSNVAHTVRENLVEVGYATGASGAVRKGLVNGILSDYADIQLGTPTTILRDKKYTADCIWSTTNALCTAASTTLKCEYQIESTEDFLKDQWSLDPTDPDKVSKKLIVERAKMFSGSNSPSIVITPGMTKDALDALIEAIDFDKIGVTMF